MKTMLVTLMKLFPQIKWSFTDVFELVTGQTSIE